MNVDGCCFCTRTARDFAVLLAIELVTGRSTVEFSRRKVVARHVLPLAALSETETT